MPAPAQQENAGWPARPGAAFAGRLQLTAGARPGRCAVSTLGGRALLTGAGFAIDLDPARTSYHVDDTSVTLCTGRADDTSFLAAAHRFFRSGGNGPEALRGRFALAHLDLAAARVWLLTDRFGVHPICYQRYEGVFHFADRADAMPAETQPSIDPQAIFNYVYFHMIPGPRTIFRGVARVEPAQMIVADATGERASFWWRPAFGANVSTADDALKARFRDLVHQAVQREASTDRVGCFLSGGTDSSTVSGFLGKITGRPAETFSIGFDAEGYDEMSYARIAAKHFGTHQHEYYVTPDDLVQAIPRVAASYDQPFGNSSALPGYYCALRAKEAGITKLLAGDGGDELFGGNTRYAKQKVFAIYDRIPQGLRAGLVEPLLLGGGGVAGRLPLVKKGVSYVEQARVPMPRRMETYNLLLRFGAVAVFTPALLQYVRDAEPADLQRRVYEQSGAVSIVDRMLAYDWRFTLADNDLPKVCGTTRLAGEDVGFPLLDDDLLDFSLTLAPALKVRGLALRYFFKEALRGFLPDEIIRKRKHGFGLPFGPWLVRHAPLRALAKTALEHLAERGVVQPALVRELFSIKLAEHPGYFGEMIWVLMMLEHWLAARQPAYRV